MNLLLVSFENPDSFGVSQKLGAQLKYLKQIDKVNVSGVVIHNNSNNKSVPTDWKQLNYNIRTYSGIWNRRYFRTVKPFFEYLSQRKQRLLTLDYYIANHEVDTVYLRYPTADYFLLELLKKHASVNWFFEHNTKELSELYLNRNKWHDSKFVWWFERIFGRLCLKHASGIVGVTNEIVKYELKRLGDKKPNLVIGNGIDDDSINQKNTNAKQQYQGVFLIGSYNDWHGLDLVPKLIMQSKERVQISIVGQIPLEIKTSIGNKNITYKDKVLPSELSSYLKNFDFGVGTLALERKNMVEAVSLKTRDYLKNGLPVILNYLDTDVKDMKGVFYWNIKQENVLALISFLDNKQTLSVEMVKHQIGMKSKMIKLYKFISSF